MRQKSKPRYAGALAKPIPYGFFCVPTLFGGGRSVQAGRLQTVILEKLDALCRHHGVESDEVNRAHALTLARRYVPGFQIARGKPQIDPRKKWDDIRLARLRVLFRAARPKFPSDRSALAYIAKQKDLQQITGKAKFVWLEQLLDKARLSPLVQMMESGNPADRKFAWSFLAAFIEDLDDAASSTRRSS
jgi:hypothetical protein